MVFGPVPARSQGTGGSITAGSPTIPGPIALQGRPPAPPVPGARGADEGTPGRAAARELRRCATDGSDRPYGRSSEPARPPPLASGAAVAAGPAGTAASRGSGGPGAPGLTRAGAAAGGARGSQPQAAPSTRRNPGAKAGNELRCHMCVSEPYQAAEARGLMQHLGRAHLGETLSAETIAQLRALGRGACVKCEGIRVRTNPQCQHCGGATSTRPLRLGDRIPARRRGEAGTRAQPSQEG